MAAEISETDGTQESREGKCMSYSAVAVMKHH